MVVVAAVAVVVVVLVVAAFVCLVLFVLPTLSKCDKFPPLNSHARNHTLVLPTCARSGVRARARVRGRSRRRSTFGVDLSKEEQTRESLKDYFVLIN